MDLGQGLTQIISDFGIFQASSAMIDWIVGGLLVSVPLYILSKKAINLGCYWLLKGDTDFQFKNLFEMDGHDRCKVDSWNSKRIIIKDLDKKRFLILSNATFYRKNIWMHDDETGRRHDDKKDHVKERNDK